MAFTVETRDILAALTSLITGSKVIEKSTAPILEGVHLKALDAGRLALTGNNMDQSQTTYIAADVEAVGEMVVNAKKLQGFVKGLPKGSRVSVSIEEGVEGKAIFKSGLAKLALEVLDLAAFPVLESKYVQAEAFTLEPAVLLKALDQTVCAISNEETRYYLNGVYMVPVVEGIDRLIRFVATDGHRLHKTNIDAPHSIEGRMHAIPGVIIPRQSVDALRKLLKKAVTVQVHVCAVRVEFGISYNDRRDVIYTAKVIDGTFPEYERCIPAAFTEMATIDRGELGRIAGVMGKQTELVKLSFSEGTLKISAKAEEFSSEEKMECEYDGRDFEVGFSGMYLSQALAALEGEHGQDRVQLHLQGGSGPMLINARDGGRVSCVVMPVRI